MTEIVKELPERETEAAEAGIRIAVVGRQNVGKSTLVNKIAGQKRVIVSEEAGTTRDAIDTRFEQEGDIYTIIDTAGIRRRGKIEKGTEWLSVTSAIFSLERCDVALLLLDPITGITKQDTHIAGFAAEAGRASVIVVNKWDIAKEKGFEQGAFFKKIRDEFNFFNFAPVVFISAFSGRGVRKIFPLVKKVMQEAHKKISTAKINKSFEKYIRNFKPPSRKGRELKINYVTQTGTAPPTFTLFVNDPELMHFSYERYIVNQIRDEYGFEGNPIRLRFRRKGKNRNKE